MNKFLLLSSFLVFCTLSLFSQTIDKAKLDQYFQLLEENDKFMGSIAISQNGVVVYEKTLGFSDIESKTKPNAESKYRIGSITKTFTTVLIMKAVEEGKLNLDQTLKKYFPSIKNAKKITIKHMLGHRSGIHNFTDDSEYFLYNTQPTTQEKILKIIMKGGSDFKPGTKASYSNSNFVLLGFILEKIYGDSYSNLLKTKIVDVLGLKNTYLDQKIETSSNECHSYSNLGKWVQSPETDISVPGAAGAISSTPRDLNTFADALFGGKLISLKSLEEMKTLQDNYGLGLFRFPFDDKWAYGHNGRVDEFNSMLSHFPEDKVSFSMISNGTAINNNDVAIAVLSAFYGKSFELPNFNTFVVTEDDLKPYVGQYSSKEMPLKITISQNGSTLIAQATGQSSFPLEATAKDTFKFDPAGVVIEFIAGEGKMVLKQGGGTYNFTKDK